MPSRLTLSAYVGPMPRPVVPILFLPRKRSVTLSTVTWYGAMTWALAETTSRSSTPSTPRAEQPVDLVEERLGRDHDAVADHRGRARREDAGGQQVGGVLLAVDDDGVAGVVAAAGADHEVDGVGGGEEVGRLALAFVAPLGAEDDDGRHRWPLSASGVVVSWQRESPGRQQPVRGSCDRRLPKAGGRARVAAVESFLVITNEGAGTADEESLELARRRPQRAQLGRGRGHLQPRRARRRPAPGRHAADRGGRRRRQPARGRVRAAPPPRPRRAACSG